MTANFFDFQKSLRAPERAAQPGPAAPLTVSQLTNQIDRVLKSSLAPSFVVRAEVSNFKHHNSSGNTYFTLKDAEACIDCVMFRADFAKLKFRPADGMELLATGRIGVYAARGRYQLYISTLLPVGQGALELAFQQLRKRLEGEGLFHPSRKRPLPRYPAHLAIITSRETAALQDILKVVGRFRFLKLSLHHVPVQGEGAAEKIAAMIGKISTAGSSRPQVILLARGGGSLEDLWPFNEECVARACAASTVPIVTGIGHEIDVSIADLVADHHAHTPTEAAQVVTAHWRTAASLLDTLSHRLARSVRQTLDQAGQRVRTLAQHEFFRRPADRIHHLRQRLDDRERSLLYGIQTSLHRLHRCVSSAAQRLDRQRPSAQVDRLRQRLEHRQHTLSLALRSRLRLGQAATDAAAGRLHSGMASRHQAIDARLQALQTQLRLVSPQHVLQRGYSITTVKRSGQIVRSAEQVKPGERLVTRLAEGSVESTAEDPTQPRLFD